MLSPGDLKKIAARAWIHDHDWQLMSLIAGEPFLKDPFLTYWDGKQLSLCTWPLDKNRMDDDLTHTIEESIHHLLDLFHPLIVDVWGPHPIDMADILPPSFRPVRRRGLDPHNINLQLDLSDYEIPRGSHLENARRAARWGYRMRQAAAPGLTWEHLRLVEDFSRRSDLNEFDRIYTAIEPWMAGTPGTRIFSVYQEDRLLGFKSMREITHRLVISKSAYYRRGVKHVSDFLNHAIYEYYIDSEFSILDMGYSGHKKLLDYKRHWKPTIENGSYQEQVYAYRSYRPDSSYSTWWARDIICPALHPSGNDC